MPDIEPGAHGGARSNTGGARTGAGRPKKGADPTPLQAANLEYARERAAHERIKREQRELALKIETRAYLSREAFRNANGRLLHLLRDGLLGLPDTLERKGLPVEWVQAVSDAVDQHLDATADLMEAFFRENQQRASAAGVTLED